MRTLAWVFIALTAYGITAALVFRGIPAAGRAIHRHGPALLARLRATFRSLR